MDGITHFGNCINLQQKLFTLKTYHQIPNSLTSIYTQRGSKKFRVNHDVEGFPKSWHKLTKIPCSPLKYEPYFTIFSNDYIRDCKFSNVRIWVCQLGYRTNSLETDHISHNLTWHLHSLRLWRACVQFTSNFVSCTFHCTQT